MSYVDIKIPCNYIEAHLILDYLRQHNIDCYLTDDFSSTCSLAPGIIMARIMIKNEDAHRGAELVDKYLGNSE